MKNYEPMSFIEVFVVIFSILLVVYVGLNEFLTCEQKGGIETQTGVELRIEKGLYTFHPIYECKFDNEVKHK